MFRSAVRSVKRHGRRCTTTLARRARLHLLYPPRRGRSETQFGPKKNLAHRQEGTMQRRAAYVRSSRMSPLAPIVMLLVSTRVYTGMYCCDHRSTAVDDAVRVGSTMYQGELHVDQRRAPCSTGLIESAGLCFCTPIQPLDNISGALSCCHAKLDDTCTTSKCSCPFAFRKPAIVRKVPTVDDREREALPCGTPCAQTRAS